MARLMAIDYGTVRIGIALSDYLKIFPKPYNYISNKGLKKVIEEIRDLIAEKEVEKVILGYPLGLDGQKTKKTLEVENFFEILSKKLNCEVILYDESFSSKDAQKLLRELGYNTKNSREYIDSMAAYVILKNYMGIY